MKSSRILQLNSDLTAEDAGLQECKLLTTSTSPGNGFMPEDDFKLFRVLFKLCNDSLEDIIIPNKIKTAVAEILNSYIADISGVIL